MRTRGVHRVGSRSAVAVSLAIAWVAGGSVLPAPVAAQEAAGWPTGRQVRDALQERGMGFTFVDGTWRGTLADGGPSVLIGGPGGGPASVDIVFSGSDDAAPLLYVGELVGADDALLAVVLDEIDPWLTVIDRPSTCVDSRHPVGGGTIAVLHEKGSFEDPHVRFVPPGATQPVGDVACRVDTRALIAAMPASIPEFAGTPSTFGLPVLESMAPEFQERWRPFVERLVSLGGHWDEGDVVSLDEGVASIVAWRFPGVDGAGLLDAWVAAASAGATRVDMTIGDREVVRTTIDGTIAWTWVQDEAIWQAFGKDGAIDDALVERVISLVADPAPPASPAVP